LPTYIKLRGDRIDSVACDVGFALRLCVCRARVEGNLLVCLLTGRLRGRSSVKEERAENLAISTWKLDEFWGLKKISEPDLGINPLTLYHDLLHCESPMWWRRRNRVNCGLWLSGVVDGPVIPGRRALLCTCLGTRLDRVMATKTAYRAILRELYKAVRILPHPVLLLSHLYVFLVNKPKVHTKSDNCFELSRGS
jgi:hypothetical protein